MKMVEPSLVLPGPTIHRLLAIGRCSGRARPRRAASSSLLAVSTSAETGARRACCAEPVGSIAAAPAAALRGTVVGACVSSSHWIWSNSCRPTTSPRTCFSWFSRARFAISLLAFEKRLAIVPTQIIATS